MSVPVLARFREQLAAGREQGLSFDGAWRRAIATAGWSDDPGRAWLEIMEATRDSWRRAYNLEPPTDSERRIAGLLTGLADFSRSAEALVPSAGVSSKRAPAGYADPFNPAARLPPREDDAGDRARETQRAA